MGTPICLDVSQTHSFSQQQHHLQLLKRPHQHAADTLKSVSFCSFNFLLLSFQLYFLFFMCIRSCIFNLSKSSNIFSNLLRNMFICEKSFLLFFSTLHSRSYQFICFVYIYLYLILFILFIYFNFEYKLEFQITVLSSRRIHIRYYQPS